jgi:hypothetical protein
MGFFSDLEDFAKGIITTVGGIVDDVASAIARPLGVHPDVVKVAAAALGMYYQAGGFANAAGEAVSEAAAADLVAAHGAEALAVMGDASAAAELAAATGTALPYGIDPAMLASQLAAEGSIASAAHIASTAGVSTAPIVDSLIASGQYDAAVQLTMATNPMELGFVNQNIGLAKTAAEAATAFPVATSPLAAPSALAGDTLGASLSGLTSEQIAAATSANALAPGAAATGAGVANALSPEALAAYDASVGLTAGGTPATLTPEALAAYDASVGLTAGTGAGAGAGAGAAGAGAAGAGAAGAGAAGAGAAGAGAAVSGANALADMVSPGEGIDASIGEAYTDLGIGTAGLGAGAFDTLAKFAKDYGVPLSALISGITGSQAAQSAADTQAQSAREARDLAKQIYEKQVSLQEPFRTAGITAQNQLLTLLGLQGGTQGAEFGRYARPFGMQDFQADPGYAFRMSEGMKALEASRAAQRGGSTGLLSGATGKALQRYGQDLASQEYGNAFNRYQTERVNRLQPLGALMGTGQAAASNQGAAAGQYGTTAGGLTTDIGAVTAGGQLGAARAISNALSAYGNYMGNQNLAQAIRESQYIR